MGRASYLPVWIVSLSVAAMLHVGCASDPPLRQRIANAYDVQGFEQVETLRYTFNVDLGDKQISRQWVWEPRLDRVTFIDPVGDGARETTYDRSELLGADETLHSIDSRFINDKYWLLFPYQVLWDAAATVKELPDLSDDGYRRVDVIYPTRGGYTPGDAYRLYLDENNIIVRWDYFKAGSPTPTRTATWAPPTRVGPILLSLDHHGESGFRVWFTDVRINQQSGSR